MQFNKSALSLTLGAVIAVSAAHVVAKPMDATLFVGETKFLADPSIKNILVGSDSVLMAKPVPGRGIALTAIAPGDTTVKLWSGADAFTIDVHVTPTNVARIQKELGDYLATVPGVSIGTVGDHVVVTGDSLSKSDKIKVDAAVGLYPGVVNLTSTMDKNTGLKHQMVYLDVRIVEISSKNSDEFGIKWNGTGIQGPQAGVMQDFRKSAVFTDPANPLASSVSTYPMIKPLAAYLSVSSFIDSKINLMEERGTAKMIARPLLSCKNGGKASFLSGGQIPYQTVGATGTPSTDFKDYGIKLDIQPAITTEGIAANILAEVSDIDSSVTVNGVPGMLTRRTNTDFVVKEGQTIVLSGLVSTSKSKTDDSIPLLGRIPVLKWLFNDRSLQSKKTELLIFVTPYMYDGNDAELKQAIDNGEHERLDQQGKNVLIPNDLGQLPTQAPAHPELKPPVIEAPKAVEAKPVAIEPVNTAPVVADPASNVFPGQ